MDLNTITEVARPTASVEGINWRNGDAWLAGGTWLFSEPQPHLRRLIDLQGLGWSPLVTSEQGLEIAATCQIAKLAALSTPAEWLAAPLIDQCCPLVPLIVQNLAHGDGRRKYLHVVARRPDDLTGGRARRRLYDHLARWRASSGG